MNKHSLSFILIISLLLFAGCNNKKQQKKVNKANPETTAEPDTGFTGIKQYKSRNLLIKEVTFKNGVRDGLMKSFYMGGQLYQTFWYENGLKEDSARWYYLEGQLFRTTPYKHDTVNGIQKQFYRDGKLKAKIGYSKGMRTMFFQEFTPEGKLVGQYPEITVAIQDNYKNNGTYTINLGLNDKNTKVKFFCGGIIDERFDTTKCKYIKPINEKSFVILKKSNKQGPDHLDIVASITTLFGNKYLEYKKIDLPYNDLN
jgi:antitoxin component YwqK of YwqJK toxin-antitoxin module